MADGELTIDEFELVNLVASGGTSQVWEVREKSGRGNLAMKLLLDESVKDSDAKATLRHEYKVGKALTHPSFVNYQQLTIGRDHCYIIMDYFRSPSIKNQIAGDRLGLHSRFAKLVESTCLALGYMHDQGWLHRDLKPDNILMNKSGEVRLIDFSLSTRISSGIGKLLGGKLKTIQGTRTYIAPETLLKKKPTIQTDMYSLGITFYECLVGQPPFKGTTPQDLLKRHIAEKPIPPSAINTNVTPELDAFILHLLEKKPEKRPRDMNDMAAEFRSVKPFVEEIEDLKARLQKEREEEEKERLQSLAGRLDSRTDAQRSEYARETGEELAPVKKPKKAPARRRRSNVEKQSPPPAAQPSQQPPVQTPQPMPGYPQGMMPQQMPPGYMPQPMPGQMMPGQPMPPQPGYPMPGQQIPPGYGQQMPMPQPGQPGMPTGQSQPPMMQPGAAPPQQMPPQQMPPQQAPAQQAPVSQPPQQQVPPQPAAPQQPAEQTPDQPADAQDAAIPGHGPLRDVRRQPKIHPSQMKKPDDDLPLMDELPDVL